MDPCHGGPDWMKITPVAGFLFHEKEHHGDVKGRRHHVGPLRRHGADNVIVDAQQQSLAEAVPAFADAHERAARERMEGMGYADKLRRGSGKVCIPS